MLIFFFLGWNFQRTVQWNCSCSPRVTASFLTVRKTDAILSASHKIILLPKMYVTEKAQETSNIWPLRINSISTNILLQIEVWYDLFHIAISHRQTQSLVIFSHPYWIEILSSGGREDANSSRRRLLYCRGIGTGGPNVSSILMPGFCRNIEIQLIVVQKVEKRYGKHNGCKWSWRTWKLGQQVGQLESENTGWNIATIID